MIELSLISSFLLIKKCTEFKEHDDRSENAQNMKKFECRRINLSKLITKKKKKKTCPSWKKQIKLQPPIYTDSHEIFNQSCHFA